MNLTTPDVPHNSLGRFFTLLESIEHHAVTGLLTVKDSTETPTGTIVSYKGGICLVRGVAGVPVFQDYLYECNPRYAHQFAEALSKANNDTSRISEVVDALGHSAIASIKKCLLAHVKDALRAMTESEVASIECAARNLAYDPSLTCQPLEIFSEAIENKSVQANIIGEFYQEFSQEADLAVLGNRAGKIIVPVAVRGDNAESMANLASIGSCLQSLSQPPALKAAEVFPSLMMFGAEKKLTIVASSVESVVYLQDIPALLRGRIIQFFATRGHLSSSPK